MKRLLALAALVLSVLIVREAATRSMLAEPVSSPPGLLRHVDEALAQQRVAVAVRASDAAYRAAVASQRWEDLIEVGDAYRRIGEVAGPPDTFDAKARDLYQSALARARHAASLDGVLRVGEAFAGLGDRDALLRCLRLAELLAGGDPDARADVRAFTSRFADQLGSTEK